MSSQRKGKVIAFLVPDDLLSWVKSSAEKENRTVSNWLQCLVQKEKAHQCGNTDGPNEANLSNLSKEYQHA